MNEPSTQPKFTSAAVESAINEIGKQGAAGDTQGALDALARVQAESAATPNEDFYMPRDRMGALLQSTMSEHVAKQATEEGPAVPLNLMFSDVDPGWISVVPSLLDKWLTVDAKFRTHTDHRTAYTMSDNAKVALFADWATGQPAAIQVMDRIRERNPDVLVHLGDIYYSGQSNEAQSRFLKHLPPASPNLQRFALNGNHEMYSGGHGYFDDILAEMDQEASYFCLTNSHWRLIGLDSAYQDKKLKDPQLAWLKELVKPNDGRKNILMSHHQAFSMFEEVDSHDLWEPIRPLIEAGKIHAWFWGHEHKHVAFRKYKGLVARCIGHGAIPSFPPGKDFLEQTFPDLKVKFVNRRVRPGTLQAVNGCAMLRFNGPSLEVDYIDDDGFTRTEDIVAILAGTSD